MSPPAAGCGGHALGSLRPTASNAGALMRHALAANGPVVSLRGYGQTRRRPEETNNVIEYDTSRAPTGYLGRQRLLDAIYRASGADENEWVEFKAGVDPSTRAGYAHIARAIVAFANRDPARAQRWMDGNAYIIVGLEPGNAPGAVVLDPAIIHDGVNALIAAPAPGWDLEYTTYNTAQVLVVTVEPPKPGDPIHCISKAAPNVDNGNIFVRRPGKSDRAKSDDIRRLSTRVTSVKRDVLSIDVAATVPAWEGLPRCTWPENWIEAWIDQERAVLLAPLERDLNPPAQSAADRLGLSALGISRSASFALGITETPEDRSPDRYRAEVEKYLERCRDGFTGAEERAAARVLPVIAWGVENLSDNNLENLLVSVHVEGDVFAFDSSDNFSLRPEGHKRPRLWGPRKLAVGFDRLNSQLFTQTLPATYGPPSPRPSIQNGGSARIAFPALHLRPRSTEVLEGDLVLMVLPNVPGPIQCKWTATATNLSAVGEGEFSIPVVDDPVSLDSLLAHREPRPWVIRPGEQSDDPEDDHDW